jgi:hypothetical protein
MSVGFHRSASRHGISPARVIHVIDNCPCPIYPAGSQADEEDLVLFLWMDQHGIPLEVIAVEGAEGSLVVIHAMRMRPTYAAQYAEVLKCR